jgi:transposase
LLPSRASTVEKESTALSLYVGKNLIKILFLAPFFYSETERAILLKILVYDGQGFWLCTKRLSKGQFYWWPKDAQMITQIPAHDLQTLLCNWNPDRAGFAKDWKKVCL